ncbi:hypothetical protein FSP39_010024 [Pinctada imbricata]|uniref:Uncharacterized protein n=1 Tax=Pinctada imbricata TaxID=66713 RepID=A0AA88XD31_PINIB|nr:hypothetical protein FSP39_010024 [Pinctada imbricata]
MKSVADCCVLPAYDLCWPWPPVFLLIFFHPDFQKAAAFINEFLLKLNEEQEGAELRDTLNLALLHMQKYYRLLQTRSHEKNTEKTLTLSARGWSPLTPFVDAPDKFQWKWINLDSMKSLQGIVNTEESMNITTLPPIMQAVKHGNADLLMQLVQEDPGCVDEQDGLGRTALSYAVHFHQMEMLHYLLENQADVNVASHGCGGVLENQADVNVASHSKLVCGCEGVLENQADVNVASHSTLVCVCGGGGVLENQADVNVASHGKLVCGCEGVGVYWRIRLTSMWPHTFLIQHNADVNVRDKDGLTPCMWACRLDHIKHFELLSSSHNFHVDEVDGIERDANGRTWMHWSVRRTEPLECLQTLLTSETAGIKDEDGKTVLLLAAETGSLLACKIIVEIAGKKRLGDKDNNDRSALHLASIGGHGDVINYLLDQGADLSLLDKFNATAWDYARNRQLHYCQLIIMSHQRQRLQSNPSTPVPNGMGLTLMLSGYTTSNSGDYDHMINTRGSFDNMPITPPHPPKRPRTMLTPRTPMRRTQSQGVPERENTRFSMEERQTTSAGGELNNKRRERIQVNLHTRRSLPNGLSHREDVPMVSDEELPVDEEDIDGVSVGGMDVSDIEEEQGSQPPLTSRQAPPNTRNRQGQMNHLGQPSMQPRPPPRYPPSPPKQSLSQSADSPFNKPRDENQDVGLSNKPNMQPKPPPKYNQRVISPHFNQATNPSDSFPPSRPRPAPRYPGMKQNPRPPPPRRTPSPNRPGSGRDQGLSPPGDHGFSKQPSPPSDQARPDSGSRAPVVGVVEGRKIPPPMLTPLENAPIPPSLSSIERKERKKKKKRREREQREKEREKEAQRENEMKSPPMDLQPPRGYAAPLHPPPSASLRSQRAQSGVPAPRYSKQPPQRHEPSRYLEETMDEEHQDAGPKPPMMNGHASPVKDDLPPRSSDPVSRMNELEDDDDIEEIGDTAMQDVIQEEDDVAGPLIPPPQGFRSPAHQRPLSQSIPQVGSITGPLILPPEGFFLLLPFHSHLPLYIL